ncbi:MAG: hypothetical protein ACYDHC_02875 [Desulfuromonadaceae bacterium]
MNDKLNILIAMTVLLIVAGCGTLTNGGQQSIFVQAVAENKVVDASCNIKNSAGSWQIASSNDVVIKKSAGELVIECLSKDHKYAGKEIISSETNASMWASIFTVGVGAAVDAASAAGFDYPRNLIIVMKNKSHGESN